jgi:hypothetical protein
MIPATTMINRNHQNMLWYCPTRFAMTAGDGTGDDDDGIGCPIAPHCTEEHAKSMVIYMI